MPVTVRLRDEQSLEWLYQSVTKTLTNLQNRISDGAPANAGLLELLEGLLMDLHEAVSATTTTETPRRRGRAKTIPSRRTGRTTRTSRDAAPPPPETDRVQEVGPLPAPKLCATHPKYGAIRSPRIDCDDCWAVYTKLNPARAPLARSKFEREQRRKRQ